MAHWTVVFRGHALNYDAIIVWDRTERGGEIVRWKVHGYGRDRDVYVVRGLIVKCRAGPTKAASELVHWVEGIL